MLGLVIAYAAGSHAAKPGPNVLLAVFDDLRPQLACYNNRRCVSVLASQPSQ